MGNFFRNPAVMFLSCGFFLYAGFAARAQSAAGFIENKNQWPADVHFLSQVPGGKMAVGPASFRYYFIDYAALEKRHHQSHHAVPDGPAEPGETIRGHAVFVDFLGANRDATPRPFGRSAAYYNYYIGSDVNRWASEARRFEGMHYPELYPGIDLKVYVVDQHIKYDLIIAPGGDPAQILMRYQGAEELVVDQGDLHVRTTLADIIEKKPVAWQVINGSKTYIACSFDLQGNAVSFAFPDGFDPCYPLVIDPLLIFSTYSGSTADNWGSTATPGEHGNLYSAGVTEQGGGTFPATPGAYQTASAGLYDIGILKYDSLGSNLLFATYLGGNNSESPHSLIMNDAQELLLLGTTSSADYPVTAGALGTTFRGGTATSHVVPYSAGSDIVISRFNRSGTALLASTFLGGSANDGLNPGTGALTRNYGDELRGDIITDAEGNVYVCSVTQSSDLFPSTPGFEQHYQGGVTDALLVKVDPALTQIHWATYLGGSGTDAAHTLKLDADNNVFVAGGTSSVDFPVTTGSYQAAYGGGVDGWIAKIASNGSGILHATFTGTANYDQVYFLDLNAREEVYVYGQTSGSFPVTPGVYSNPGSGQFIQKFDNTLKTLGFSTVFGAGRGVPDISPTAFLVNDCNNLYMSGWGGIVNTANGYWSQANSGTNGMPVTPDAFQATTSGSDFYFIVLTDDAKERLYATFLGGSQSRTHVDGGTSRFDKSGVVYHSVCSGCAAFNASRPAQPTSDFPTTPGAWSRTNNSRNCNNAAFKFDLSSLKARIRTNSEKRDAPGLEVVCLPDAMVFENISTGGEVFEWDFGDGTGISKTDTAFIIHKYSHAGEYRVKLKAIDYGTCQVADSTFARVTVNVAESSVQDDANVCFGDEYQLKATGAVQYHWTSRDGTFVSTESSPVIIPADTTAYYVVLTEANGCVRRDTVQLNVVPGITPAFEWEKLPDCMARPRIAVRNMTDSLATGDHLFFDFGDGTLSDLPEDIHFFEKDGLYDIRLLARREFCIFESSVSVPVFRTFIPNVITPGLPDHNDVFTIRFGEVDGVTPADYGFAVSLTIYNRWGQTVYQTDDYQYDWSGDGLAPGIYYYEVTIENHGTCKSWLHLMR